MRVQLRRSFVNYRLEQPYQHAAFGVQHLTAETQWTQEERLAELDSPCFSSFFDEMVLMRYGRRPYGREPPGVHRHPLRAYAHRDPRPRQRPQRRSSLPPSPHRSLTPSPQDALVLAKLAESTFSPSPLTPTELLSHRSLIISEGKHLLRQDVGNPENVNSAVEQFTYCGDLTDEAVRTRLSVLSAMVQEPLFDDLRAKQQLGYIVRSLSLLVARRGVDGRCRCRAGRASRLGPPGCA